MINRRHASGNSTSQKGPLWIAKQSGPVGTSHTDHDVNIMEIFNLGVREEARLCRNEALRAWAMAPLVKMTQLEGISPKLSNTV